ncbi:MAG: hypothetical protein ACHQ50_12850, partial [Fimbriimonadales bacterium]
MSNRLAQRAIYGDRGGEHGLIAHSGGDDSSARRLAAFTDLPDLPPAGLEWEPFFSGARVGDLYFAARTTPDRSASRPGMVRTQMLILDCHEAAQLDTLAPILAELEVSWETIPSLLPYEVLTAPDRVGTRQPCNDALLRSVAELIVQGSHGGAIAVLDQARFPEMVLALWNRLWPEARRDFSFGFSFTPADLSGRQLDLVAAPPGMRRRWFGYRLLASEVPPTQPVSVGVGFLLGLPEGTAVKDFLDKAALSLPSLARLTDLISAASYWLNRATASGATLRALCKLLAVFAPDESAASAVKREALELLGLDLFNRSNVQGATRASSDEILALRNFPFASFSLFGSTLSLSVMEWVNARLGNNWPDEYRRELLPVLRGVQGDTEPEWKRMVTAGLRSGLGGLKRERSLPDPSAQSLDAILDRALYGFPARNVWWLLQQDESIVALLFDHMPDADVAERAMTREMPGALTTDAGEAVARSALERGWLLLYAAALARTMPLRAAVERYLAADQEPSHLDPVRQLLSGAPRAEAMSLAIEIGEGRLLSYGAEACAEDPSLLSAFDASSDRWREVLAKLVQLKPLGLAASPAATRVLFGLLDAQIAGANNNSLIVGLAECGLTDLIDYPKRSSVWSLLPRTVADKFAERTATEWVRRVYADADWPPDPERELRDALFLPSLASRVFPRGNRRLAEVGLRLLTSFDEATETACCKWLDAILASGQRLEPKEGRALGNLLVERRWPRAATKAKDAGELMGRSDLAAPWNAYSKALDPVTRLADTLSNITSAILGRKHSAAAERDGTPAAPPIRAVFLTALKEEFQAVRAHLSAVTPQEVKGTVSEVGRFDYGDASCLVAIVQTGMGNVSASVETERALEHFKPEYAFFVGIAGGLKDELQLGDVVAATKIYGYEHGKSADEFIPRPDAPP